MVCDAVWRAALRKTAACVLGLNVTHPIDPYGEAQWFRHETSTPRMCARPFTNGTVVD